MRMFYKLFTVLLLNRLMLHMLSFDLKMEFKIPLNYFTEISCQKKKKNVIDSRSFFFATFILLPSNCC